VTGMSLNVFAAFPPRRMTLAVCMDVGMRCTARFVSFIRGSKSTTNMFYKALETFNSRTIQSPCPVKQSRRKLLAAERLLLLYIFLGHINLSDSEVKSRRYTHGLERSVATTEERIESSWPVLRSQQRDACMLVCWDGSDGYDHHTFET